VIGTVFFPLSKSLDVLASPLTWAIALALLGFSLRRRRVRLAAGLTLSSVAVLVLFSLEPVAGTLVRRVESGARRTFTPGTTYDAVIVLGGGIVDPGGSSYSGELELGEPVERIVRAAKLLKSGQARMVLLSGGPPWPGVPSEAESLAAWLGEQGIDADRIVVEGRSRNTRENAVESARIVTARGWKKLLLVTSAWHAPRALASFRAVGLEPDVLPVDHHANDGSAEGFLPRAGALAVSTEMLRELVGRAVYRIMRYSR
jgi:uncharacterized SAM-binding protein YcdF (DUF218 family)